MRSLKVTPENFENQLQTVKEEKRSRIDNQPYVPASIKMEELVYDNWVNGHPTIGSFEDLEASSIDDVKRFFKTYYAPNNAVMAIVGDVDANQLEPLIRKYFGSIPSQPAPPRPDVSEPPQAQSKYLKVDDPHAEAPAFWVSWKAPARRESDYYTLGVIEKLLSAGDSSRLYQRMVKGDQNALKVEAGYDERRGPSGFESFVVIKPDTTPEKVRDSLWSELDKLKTEPVSDVELEKAKNQILGQLFSSSSYTSLQRALGRAELLAEYTSFYGDPAGLDNDLKEYLKVTPADVQRVAKKIFTKEGATIVDVVPKKS
jgi:predicted Zn-dependent peptidase